MGLVTGPHTHSPCTHSQWVVGPGRTFEGTGGRGWVSARFRTPHTQARGVPPRGPSCCPHSAQSQLARAGAVGLMTGPQAHSPRTHSKWVVGPGHTPERTGVRGWESARPRTSQTQARGAAPGRPRGAPTVRKASSPEHALWGGDRSPRPHPPHPQPVGSWPRPHARKDGRSGVGERPIPDTPHPGKRRPPPGALVPPPQRPKPARKSARCGVGDGSPSPHPPRPQAVGSGPRPHA